MIMSYDIGLDRLFARLRGGEEEDHNTEGIALSQRDRIFYYASTPDVYCSYELIRTFGVPMPPDFAYCSSCLSMAPSTGEDR